jgi:nucleoside phosphorylase
MELHARVAGSSGESPGPSAAGAASPAVALAIAGGEESGPLRAIGVVCALPEEIGSLHASSSKAPKSLGLHVGIEVIEIEVHGVRVLTAVSGVGKVASARAATVLVALGATRALLVVGVCGGLRQNLGPGTLVHCTRAAQVDLAVRAGREIDSDRRLREAWKSVQPGVEGWFLTADRPVLSWWRRLRLARAFLGPCVADMETAAVASVACAAGVPWAALRAVTDRATPFGAAAFRVHYPTQAGRAADTVSTLLRRLGPA